MNNENFKPVALCTKCNKFVVCGEDCKYCSEDKWPESLRIVKYAVAMKEAINCWAKADCEEHSQPCQPTLKEFAIKILELQDTISEYQRAIINHKAQKTMSDEVDETLWKIIK